MDPSGSPGRAGRETRLLLVTIAVSVGVLLLLARFRFPDEPAQTVNSAPAPLERLAARAAYDELASTMADLERRIAPRVTILRIQTVDGRGAYTVAPRLTPDRAVALLRPEETITDAGGGGQHEIIARDASWGLVVTRVPAVDDSAVTIRPGSPRPGPRYVAVIEATAAGPALRPVYIGRVDGLDDPVTGMQLVSLTGVQHALPRGSAVFSLEGVFMGLVRDTPDATLLVAAESLRAAAQSAQEAPPQPVGDFGIDVDTLTAPIGRAAGAESGVVVVHVDPAGPAHGVLRSGDVIQAIDGTPVKGVAGFRELERGRAPGAEAVITGVRLRAPLNAGIRVADAAAALSRDSDDAGFVGQNVPGAGIEIVTVHNGGPAQRAGLQRGDVIVAVDGVPARDAAALARRFRSAAAGTPLLVTVQRGQEHRVLALEKR